MSFVTCVAGRGQDVNGDPELAAKVTQEQLGSGPGYAPVPL